MYSQRHLLDDLAALLPHGRKESKFDSKKKLYVLNELAELYNCNNVRAAILPLHLSSCIRLDSPAYPDATVPFFPPAIDSS